MAEDAADLKGSDMVEFTGSLRERVTIEHWRSARDDSGNDAGEWITSGAIDAALVPTDSNAVTVAAEGLVTRQRFRLTLRQRADVSLATRFRWCARVLAVLRVERDPRTPDRLTCLVEDRT